MFSSKPRGSLLNPLNDSAHDSLFTRLQIKHSYNCGEKKEMFHVYSYSHLRLGVFINLTLLCSPNLIAPQPITTNDIFDVISILDRDLVCMQIGLTLLAMRTGFLNLRIATSL